MKKLLSMSLAVLLVVSLFTIFTYAANEPTTEALERMISIVKPMLDVPEEFSEFTWNYSAKSAYSDESWNFNWTNPDKKNNYGRISVSCDGDGNITDYHFNSGKERYHGLPEYSKDELLSKAETIISKFLPNIHDVKLTKVTSAGLYSRTYQYVFTRYIDGYIFSDNNVYVGIDFVTGEVTQVNADYDYNLEISERKNVISPEKALEILGTKQEMKLTYLSKTVTDEETGEKLIKAFLVYKPELSYIAIDAYTGEIYDTHSRWVVNFDSSAGGGTVNGSLKEDAAVEEGRYDLTEEEKAGVEELSKLISKHKAIEIVTKNEYLYIDPALTAVDARLVRNSGVDKTVTYQNDNGSYVWNINFSNPVLDNKYSYSFASATVNAENGQLISFNTNLNDYYYYINNNLEIPAVKYDVAEAKTIAEKFADATIFDKFNSSEYTSLYMSNIVNQIEKEKGVYEPVYGAYSYRYSRVNEGVAFDSNYINIGVDGVSGKIYNFNYRWYTNIEFESPAGTISAAEALLKLTSYDGYGIHYERSITYIYKPVTEGSKKEVAAAFATSLNRTYEEGTSVEKIIEKYAPDIDREALNDVLSSGKYEELLEFISKYYGVSMDETLEATGKYIDTSEFYDKVVEARLVYSDYALAARLISPFTGKQLEYSGEEYKDPAAEYKYSDIEGHWIAELANRLSDVGIGFEGGQFQPSKIMTGDEFEKLSQSIDIYMGFDGVEQYITRIDVIRKALDFLGYGKVAAIPGIFRTDFADNSSIKEDDLGYVAIASGLGIIKGDGKSASPYRDITRAEALMILVNVIGVMNR